MEIALQPANSEHSSIKSQIMHPQDVNFISTDSVCNNAQSVFNCCCGNLENLDGRHIYSCIVRNSNVNNSKVLGSDTLSGHFSVKLQGNPITKKKVVIIEIH